MESLDVHLGLVLIHVNKTSEWTFECKFSMSSLFWSVVVSFLMLTPSDVNDSTTFLHRHLQDKLHPVQNHQSHLSFCWRSVTRGPPCFFQMWFCRFLTPGFWLLYWQNLYLIIFFSLFRVLFSSSVLNLCELVALRPDLARLKKVLYFHENQLVYPVRKDQERDFQYGYNQVLSW